MSEEHASRDDQDVGLYLWLKEATQGLGSAANRRVTAEATEHFVSLLEELRRDGWSEREARLEAVERLGDPAKANDGLVRAHFSEARSRAIGDAVGRRLAGPISTLYVAWLAWSLLERAPLNPAFAYTCLAIVFVAGWVSSLSSHYGSYVGWILSSLVWMVAFLAVGFAMPDRVNPWGFAVIIPICVWPLIRALRRMPLTSP